MAETVDYSGVPSIAVIYEGTRKSFDELQNKSEYHGRVVFITGSTATNATAEDKQQAIWVSGDNGNNAHFLDMSDVSTLAAQLKYVKGVIVNDVQYEAAVGGSMITFAGDKGIKVTVNEQSGTITFSAEEIQNAITAVNNVASAANATAATANASANAALGSIAKMWGNDTDFSIRDIAADEAGSAVEELTNGDTFLKSSEFLDNNRKILSSKLPDVIFGQLTFGGTLSYYQNPDTNAWKVILDPSTDFDDKYEHYFDSSLPGLFPDESVSKYPYFNSVNYKPIDFKNVYFIVTGDVGINLDADVPNAEETEFAVGDWCLSNGQKWAKIDNTDAVTTVADKTGAVAISDITGRDSDTTKEKVAASLDRADGSIQGLKAGKQDGIKWVDNGFIEVSELAAGTAFNPNEGRLGTIHAKTETITNETAATDGLATVADIRAYLKARLSVKVVTAN